jgi:HEPN domain-containing protein
MNALTAEWVEKAEGDYIAASILAQSGQAKVYDQICFNAQQCAEKYLKAYLQEHSTPFRKTHELDELLELCVLLDSSFEAMRVHLDGMSHAVEYRYPGVFATGTRARTAFQDITFVRTFIRSKLGLQ